MAAACRRWCKPIRPINNPQPLRFFVVLMAHSFWSVSFCDPCLFLAACSKFELYRSLHNNIEIHGSVSFGEPVVVCCHNGSLPQVDLMVQALEAKGERPLVVIAEKYMDRVGDTDALTWVCYTCERLLLLFVWNGCYRLLFEGGGHGFGIAETAVLYDR